MSHEGNGSVQTQGDGSVVFETNTTEPSPCVPLCPTFSKNRHFDGFYFRRQKAEEAYTL